MEFAPIAFRARIGKEIDQKDAKKIQANRRERSLYVKVREAVILPLHAQK